MSHICALRTVWHLHKTDNFNWLSRQPREMMFQRECKAICLPTEAQQKLGDATGQQPKAQKWIRIVRRGPVAVLMLWHELKRAFHARYPKNIAEIKRFCKKGAKLFLTIVKACSAITSNFGGGYCCQWGFEQLLNPFHAALWMFTVCAIKTQKHYWLGFIQPSVFLKLKQ